MKPSMKKLGTLGTGQEVYDRFNSHLHESVVPLLQEALAQVTPAALENFLMRQIEFGRIVGQTICIETTTQDTVVFAQRPGRQGLTRFVKNRKPENAESIVIILKKDEKDNYFVLITAFVGRLAEPEPWDRSLIGKAGFRTRSISFWSSHALVWGEEETIPGTETTQCPW